MNNNLESTIRLHDQLTAPLQRMATAMMSTINTMSSLHASVSRDFDTGAFDQARSELAMVDLELQEIAQRTERARQKQDEYNNSLDNANGLAGSLSNKLTGIIGMYASVQGMSKLVGLSDKITSNTARLGLIVDDGGSVAELEAKIYASAQRSRANYLDVTNAVAKLGLTAKDSFSGMEEIVEFTELLNKNFVVGGAGAQEQAAAMYQLTQAMASGRLQGDEYRSIIENAPLLAKAIEDYMRNVEGATGSMKDWASQGLLTSEVIKNALFNSAEQIESRFNKMPMTWGQVWNTVMNKAIQISKPFLEVLSWMAQNWSVFEPILWGLVTVLGVYGAALAVATAIKWGHSVAIAANTAFTGAWTLATFAQTAAQQGLNAALLACPLTWIIMLIVGIIALLYAVVAGINKVAGTSISATGLITGTIMFAVAAVWNLFLGLLELILGIINGLYKPFALFGNFLANIWTSPISSVIYLFQGMADFALGVLQSIASAMDFVFGTNMGDTIGSWRSGLKQMADDMVKKYAPQEKYQQYMDMDLSAKALGLNRMEYGTAFGSGYEWGKNLFGGGGAVSEASQFGDFGAGGTEQMNSIAAGMGETAYNTGEMRKTLDTTSEDLKFLKDLAERDVINRFTTAEVKIDMTGMTNKISSDMDVEDVMRKLTSGVAEAYAFAAEGVHV